MGPKAKAQSQSFENQVSYTHTHTHTDAYIHGYMHMYTLTRTHKPIYMYHCIKMTHQLLIIHTHTHTRIYTHTNTQKYLHEAHAKARTAILVKPSTPMRNSHPCNGPLLQYTWPWLKTRKIWYITLISNIRRCNVRLLQHTWSTVAAYMIHCWSHLRLRGPGKTGSRADFVF